jgi:hypothetical protein
MRYLEYILAGGVGGALGTVGLFLQGRSGETLDLLASGVLTYVNDMPLMLSALLAGLITGGFSRSAIGGIIGGLGIPLAFEAWPLLQGAL